MCEHKEGSSKRKREREKERRVGEKDTHCLQRVRIVCFGKLCWVFRFDAPFALFAISLDDKVDIVNLANFLFLVFSPPSLPSLPSLFVKQFSIRW